MSEEKLLNIGKAAEKLNISPETLRRWDKSGKLVAIKTLGGQRRYREEDLKKLLSSKILLMASEWATNKTPEEISEAFYCQNRAVFETRLLELSKLLGFSNEFAPLIISAVGEIGNNSFDHNLGNWPDVPGIFFGYDLKSGIIVLADRGQGILTTLQRVKPELYLHIDALETAFTEVITGRAPEKRGNGLKFVKKVVQKGAISLKFQTGNAKLTMNSRAKNFNLETTTDHARGTLTLIKFTVNNNQNL